MNPRQVITAIIGCLCVWFLNANLKAVEIGADETADADVEKANSYDADWKQAWVENLRAIHKRAKDKTSGFVIFIGDSISYQNQNRHFPMHYKGNHELAQTIKWSLAGDENWGGPTPPNCKNGWKLAAFDHPAGSRSYTAESGIRADQWIKGDSGKTSVTGKNDPRPIDHLLENENTGPHPASKDGYTVAVVKDAQVCFVLLGTNDVSAKRSPSDVVRDLRSIYEKLIAKDIMPVVQTLPVYDGKEAEVDALNREIRALAKDMKLPLVDIQAEFMRRIPKGPWRGKLLSDNVHPNSGPTGDPFNDPTMLNRSGSLLRGFLLVCKLHEIKKFVIDGDTPPGGSGAGADDNSEAIRITSIDIPAARVGEEYQFVMTAEDGIEPYRWSASGLPAGMRISPEGLISGTPRRAGESKVTIRVRDKMFKSAQFVTELTVVQ